MRRFGFIQKKLLVRCSRFYHSFPDPNEKAIITKALSSGAKLSDKSQINVSIDPKFRIDEIFPGFENKDVKGGSRDLLNTVTQCTTLENGLRVASEDRYSLMTSLSFVVKAGRYILIFPIGHLILLVAKFVFIARMKLLVLIPAPRKCWN